MKYALVWLSSESYALDECAFDKWADSDRNGKKLFDTKEDAITAFNRTKKEWTWDRRFESYYLVQGYAVFPYNEEEDEWYDGNLDEPIIMPSAFYYNGSGVNLVYEYMDAYTVDEIASEGEIDTETANERLLEMLSALNDTIGTFRLDHAVWRAPYGYTAADFRNDWNFLYHKYYE